ncbi:hypothetical protein BOTBODRAFT_580817 [Botryobasidium botryosum FD-172 SS1]|uniref:Protein kinase domain-containing protein n=1 Tax=Botryobasidium botryosum (strain FD-172 SS1) TaxID=930990 RepID=A0A067MQ48_BOTB1|nr:hypothetical protein BOTBODRAFT_580817 [Botryobasidium botryosum FD-172 SS1]
MIVAPESERNVYISRLLKLYAYTRVYPCENGLSSFEVVPNFSKCEGRGSFGSCCRGVFLGMQPVALKSLSADDKEKMAKRLRREATLWAKLRHPRILRFIGLYTLDRDTYMVSPYMENGHATAYVAKQPDLNCLKLLSQIAEGLEYLHDMDVVHGDLRGPNILISASGDACIADFGLSRVLADFNPQLFSTLWHTAGNPRWLAPELLVEYDVKSRGPLRTKETDVFSFGRVIVELTTACAPFAELTDRSVQVKVQPGVSVNPMRPLGEAVLARGLDDDMWELAQDCWSLDPALRPTATEVLQRLRSASRDCASPVSV